MEITFLMFSGLIIFILGIVILITKVRLTQFGIKTEGEIVDLIEDEEEIGEDLNNKITLKVYKPIIRFETLEGEEKRIVLDEVKKEKNITKGEKVNIIYYEDKENNIIVNSKKNIYCLPNVLISVGIMLAIFSVILAIR